MPQVLQNRTINTFVKGLITEATEVTFPPDASIDELNMSLDRDGSRRRRLGLKVETSSTAFLTGFKQVSGRIFLHRWNNVADDSALTFLVMQIGTTLRFFDMASSPLGGSIRATIIDLLDYQVGNGVNIANNPCDVASLDGRLYVVHPAINPIYLEYDGDTDSISATEITLKYRDFEFQGDRSTYAESQSSITNTLKYDYFNIGWDITKINSYYTSAGVYPSLTLPWYAGKDAAGDFDPTEWDRIYAGNTLAVSGHYILDYFNRDRTGASGLPNGPTNENIAQRPRAVAAYAGRVWYSGINSKNERGKILFTQVIESAEQSGLCYQDADPTAEYISDLVATDGGVLNIPDAYNIKKLFNVGSALLVFAENGVWAIRGRDNVFSATDYYVSKITSIGIDTSGSFVNVDGLPFWWSPTGIHTLSVDQVSGELREQNLSLQTIQTYFNNIGKANRSDVRVAYDQTNKKVYWIYPSDTDTSASQKSQVLVLDVLLGAFYPWTFQTGDSGQFVIEPFFYEGVGVATVQDDVESATVDVVVNNVQVVIDAEVEDYTNVSDIRWIVWDGTGVNVAKTDSTTFLDWEEVNYSSYAIAGYDFSGSMTLRKNAPVVTTMLGITETGFSGNDTSGYDLIRPSSCLMSVYWDLRTSASTSPKQIYRLTRPIIVDTSNLGSFDYPYTVIQTRQGVRGRGRSMRIKFESEQGKDFHLLGYEVITAINRII